MEYEETYTKECINHVTVTRRFQLVPRPASCADVLHALYKSRMIYIHTLPLQQLPAFLPLLGASAKLLC